MDYDREVYWEREQSKGYHPKNLGWNRIQRFIAKKNRVRNITQKDESQYTMKTTLKSAVVKDRAPSLRFLKPTLATVEEFQKKKNERKKESMRSKIAVQRCATFIEESKDEVNNKEHAKERLNQWW